MKGEFHRCHTPPFFHTSIWMIPSDLIDSQSSRDAVRTRTPAEKRLLSAPREAGVQSMLARAALPACASVSSWSALHLGPSMTRCGLQGQLPALGVGAFGGVTPRRSERAASPRLAQWHISPDRVSSNQAMFMGLSAAALCAILACYCRAFSAGSLTHIVSSHQLSVSHVMALPFNRLIGLAAIMPAFAGMIGLYGRQFPRKAHVQQGCRIAWSSIPGGEAASPVASAPLPLKLL